MKKKGLYLVVITMVIVLALGGCSGQKEKNKEAVGFESFTTTDIDGNTVTQDVLQEADLTVLNIWGTFCNPCIKEMPDLGILAEEYKDKGVQFIGLPIDVHPDNGGEIEKANEIIKKTEANYLHILNSKELDEIYMGSVSGVPETLFIDKDGKIIDAVTGSQSKEKWEELINDALEQVK